MPELNRIAELLASELVTNAYLCFSGPYSIRLRRRTQPRTDEHVGQRSAHPGTVRPS